MSTRFNRNLITATLDLIGLWNILPYNFLNTGVAVVFCSLFNGKICDFAMSLFADEDPTIDYTERYDVYMSNEPSGAGFRNFLHYAQLIDLNVEAFRRWDFEDTKLN
jgi:hypothetical protein